jgi:DNA polymerase III alpha subunit
MKSDKYNRQILNESDICELYLADPDRTLKNVLIENGIDFNDDVLELTRIPKLVKYQKLSISVDEFDKVSQNNWYMPDEYINFDVAKWVLDQCKQDHELQRVGEELIKFQEYGLFPLLCYCKYLVDTMRKHNIVWGVGRGSSVSSYVLYLIGIHRINSLHYDLSIDEFLK